MGIYIQGMEIPEKQTLDTLTIFPNGYVAIYDAKDSFIGETKAFPVPKHGRLIDADALFDFVLSIYKTAQGDARKAYCDVLDIIVAAGDVIPAEEEA